MVTAVPLALGLVVLAAAMWSIIGPAARGDLPRNGLAGIRTRATRASDAAWVAGHRAALPRVRVAAVIASVFAGLTLIAGPFGDWAFWVGMAGFAATVATLLLATRAANRAARATVQG